MSACPYLSFDDNVPGWVRRRAHYWVKRLMMTDWTLTFHFIPADQFQKRDKMSVLATSEIPCAERANYVTLAEYTRADIWISEEATKEEIDWLIKHELRHMPYSWFEYILRLGWDKRRKMEFDDVLRLLLDKTEELIERDCKIL